MLALTFPALGSVALQVGPLPIRWYALASYGLARIAAEFVRQPDPGRGRMVPEGCPADAGRKTVTAEISPDADHALRRDGQDLEPSLFRRASDWLTDGVFTRDPAGNHTPRSPLSPPHASGPALERPDDAGVIQPP